MIEGPLPIGIAVSGPSFTDLLRALDVAPNWDIPVGGNLSHVAAPEATTVLAVRYDGGAVMIGDRQATEGYWVAHRRIQKVFAADGYSAVAISGTAGLAIELVRLFQTELEHYEKLEGVRLSLDGKATYLARMVRQQLPMAMQGLVVVPVFCGFDESDGSGKVFTFDAVGGRYEEQDFGATGSGSREAKSFLRTVFRPSFTESEAVDAAFRAIIAAADEDVATGGPDVRRGIYPNIVTVSADGVATWEDDAVVDIARSALRQAT
ncbi:MAG: proteasome subunit beta [Acidimicrobiia bacterium]|nr:proteasome subunit beta [Acidimicrobiia bacterium]